MDEKRAVLADLFFNFMKAGLFTFGGGYAMISVIWDTGTYMTFRPRFC